MGMATARHTKAARETATQKNWVALQRIAREFFLQARKANPAWTVEDFFEAHSIPQTALMQELAKAVGFSTRTEPTQKEIALIQAMLAKGIVEEFSLAQETGIDVHRIRKAILLLQDSYGEGSFGVATYGGNRQVSDGRSSVPRKVTLNGQLYYRGHVYNLGTNYRGRIAMVCDQGKQIVAVFNDRPTLVLDSRHYRTT